MLGTLRKLAIASVASVAIIGASLTAPTTADARHWGGGWRGGGWGWGGVGVGLGAGLLIGAAAATYPYYGGYGPAYGYYGGPYAYDYGYPGYGYAAYGSGGCTIMRRWVSDGYGHRVWRRVRTCY